MDADRIDREAKRLLARCRELAGSGRPERLEALWDGDTEGWMLGLHLTVTRRLGWTKRVWVETLRYGGDIRLFTGEVPPWPEALVAQRLAAELQQAYGCELWFPSPNDPDDQNPSYAERDAATSCADCSKLFLPSNSPYLPKEVCYHCHLEREQRAKLLREPSEDIRSRQLSATFVVEDRRLGGFSFGFASEPFRQFTAELAEILPGFDPLIEQRLETATIAAIARRARSEVDELLQSYQPPRESRAPLFDVEWEGRTLQLDLHLNREHRMLREAIGKATSFAKASSEGAVLELINNIGIKYRDFGVLCWIRSRDECPSEAAIVEHWAERLGGPGAVTASFERLIDAGCLTREAGVLSATAKGLRIDGPEESPR